MKKAVRTVIRPRWLLVPLAVAAIAVPALMISSGASASKSDIGGPSNPAHPVVDADWIYANNFYGGTHFIYKMAGADGCMINQSTCNTSGGGTQNDLNNLPQNYNGAQEFAQWWGVTGSNHDHNGPLGRFQSVRHHLYAVKSWALDDLQITIPGATCAGEQIHTAFHSDSTAISNVNPGTSLTPLSGMHSGSFANGDVYDANMGGIMNWEEVGSVLRWHAVNGTYPSKTISETNYDAELAGLVGSGDYSSTGGGATSLVAPASVGDTNIKVASVSALNSAGTSGIFGVGQPVAIDETNTENDTVASIGTSGVSGTGVTLTQPLTKAHAVGTTVNGPTTGLISDSPQGQIVMVLNNDQDGLDYPAPKWGTDHYMNDLINGGVGPWFNNINATPLTNTGTIYSSAGFARLQHNLPNVVAFRNSVANAVQQAFVDLGQKYNYSIPLENPDLLKNTGSTPDNPLVQFRPAYSPGDQAQYSPVLDDRTGRTDQVSFGNRGIPSLGDIGQYDSNTTPLIGGNENPYPAGYPSKPTLSGMFGQDSNSDYFSNLNYWASGTVHGAGGYDKPSEGLLRGVETIATWFSYVIASPAGGGATPMPDRPIAYFDQTPRKATATRTVTYDAGYTRTKDGTTDGLTYYWDFGDGTPMQRTSDPIIDHTFPAQAGWYDVKLMVAKGDKFGFFRQVEPIDFFPTYYPAVPPASEPLPPTTGPAADPCGTLSTDEQNAMLDAKKHAQQAPSSTQTQNDLASYALKIHN